MAFSSIAVTAIERSVTMRPIDDHPDSPEHPPCGSPATGRHSGPEQSGDFRVLVKVLRPGSAARRARGVVRGVLRQAGLDEDAIGDAELIVAELAANAEKHSRPPYELRVLSVGRVPTWCEIVDGDPTVHEIRTLLKHLDTSEDDPLALLPHLSDDPLLTENGRGLLMAHRLSGGNCRAYPTTILTTNTPGKAVAYALPTATGKPVTSLRTSVRHSSGPS
jgi:anti-sigma regulatory factor (Ser/Thr protein kinase)